MNASELEFNKRKMLLEQIIDNCYSEMEKYKFTILYMNHEIPYF